MAGHCWGCDQHKRDCWGGDQHHRDQQRKRQHALTYHSSCQHVRRWGRPLRASEQRDARRFKHPFIVAVVPRLEQGLQRSGLHAQGCCDLGCWELAVAGSTQQACELGGGGQMVGNPAAAYQLNRPWRWWA